MAITQKELARLLGVSQMTISRCLRSAPHVSGRMHDRVLAAAREHGYSLDDHFHAGALRRRRDGERQATNVICVFGWVPAQDIFGFHRRILQGACDGAEADGNEAVIVRECLDPRGPIEPPRVVRRGQVDGMVWLFNESARDCGVADTPVPWVSILVEVPGRDAVTVDHRDATRELGRHLCRLGHRRLAFIGPDTALARQRLAGLREAAAEAGGTLPEEAVILRHHTVAFGQSGEMATALADRAAALPAAARFTVLVAYNDLMALDAIAALRRQGWRVPQDLGVAGFDGIMPTLPDVPRLTTVAMPLEELGSEAAHLVAWRLKHPAARRTRRVLPTTVVAGETVGAVNSEPAARGPGRRRAAPKRP